MNRAFPGPPDGAPAQKIADCLQRVLLPMADIVFDFFSGGRTPDFRPLKGFIDLRTRRRRRVVGLPSMP
ncbi:M14 family metallopeptidase [Roseobacter weihaiensis]|uniref:succinylglutamate desuccinylase/aspartoacylase domain-containing protein n=1 Tax=Roseobacter weihaiensis TaxID=2763262 RepID=UPI001D0AB9E7|nr:succinylglutamate desuccinylase/aspartoacylase family protein [Roseobacter sp. H9]